MSHKTPAIVSASLTIFLLILLGVLSVFIEMLALNGVSERQGVTAIGVSLVCQSIAALLAGALAAWASSLLIAKFKMKRILTVIIAVIVGTAVGGIISLLSIIIAIPMAGIR